MAAKDCSDTACLLWGIVRGAYFEVLSNLVEVDTLEATEVKIEVETGWLPPRQLAGLHAHTSFSNACCRGGVGHCTEPQGAINIHKHASAMPPAGVGHWNGHQGIVDMLWHNCPEEGVFNTIRHESV